MNGGVSTQDRTRRYVDAAVAAELESLASTVADRNAALNRAAFALGTLVGVGAVSEDDAFSRLTVACEANGYARKDGWSAVRSSIRSGLRGGAKSPRTLPASSDGRPANTDARSHPILRAPVRALSPEPDYPALSEVEAILRNSRVDEHPVVRRWLSERRIDSTAVADRGYARALGRSVGLPQWAGVGSRDWFEAGYHLMLPLVDARGELRSVLARNVVGSEPKSVAARGYSRRGLVLACGLARQVLASGQTPEWWPATVPLRVEICEGEKKFLMRSTRFGVSDDFAPAVIGIESGSWTDDLASRLPSGCRVFCSTDPDEAGAKYAGVVVRTLEARVRAREVVVELRMEHVLVQGDDGELTVRLRGRHD
jgi:hypothetical protein